MIDYAEYFKKKAYYDSISKSSCVVKDAQTDGHDRWVGCPISYNYLKDYLHGLPAAAKALDTAGAKTTLDTCYSTQYDLNETHFKAAAMNEAQCGTEYNAWVELENQKFYYMCIHKQFAPFPEWIYPVAFAGFVFILSVIIFGIRSGGKFGFDF